MLDKRSLKKLNRNLPKSPVPKIKEKLVDDYTDAYIRMVLKGERSNQLIITAAIDVAKAYQLELKKINDSVGEI